MQNMDGNMIGGPAESGKPQAPEHPNTSEQDDFEAAAESTVDFDQFMPQLKKKHTVLRAIAWAFVILLVLAAVGGGVYELSKQKSPTKSTTSSQHTSKSKQQPAITAATMQYNSSNFNLTLNYPQGWNVSDNGNGKLTVTSPNMQLTGANGQSQTGQVVLAIQNENAMNFSMFSQGNAVAVLPSQHIAYANPTPTQRATTYVSFLQYAATNTHGALDGIYVTGNSGYQQGQVIPEVDITKVDPVITVTFNQCSNVTCGSSKPMSIDASMWNDSGFSGPILKMIESLALQ